MQYTVYGQMRKKVAFFFFLLFTFLLSTCLTVGLRSKTNFLNLGQASLNHPFFSISFLLECNMRKPQSNITITIT
jgi:hypothetical protein